MALNFSRRCVYVGNLPYRATEEEVRQTCELIGPVVSLQVMHDKSGKPKGYAFCEYKDEETALCALRNLQGHEMGGRPLRVDFAGNNDNSAAAATDHHAAPQSAAQPAAGAAGDHDALAAYLAAASREVLIQLLSEMSIIAKHDLEFAQLLLECNPPLASALYKAQFMLGTTPQDPQQQDGPVSVAARTQTPVMCAGQNGPILSGYGCEGSQRTDIDRPAMLATLEEGTVPVSGTIINNPTLPMQSFRPNTSYGL